MHLAIPNQRARRMAYAIRQAMEAVEAMMEEADEIEWEHWYRQRCELGLLSRLLEPPCVVEEPMVDRQGRPTSDPIEGHTADDLDA